MRTTRLAVAWGLLSLAACGGNYSNDDVIFRSAVPSKETLASRLTSSSTSALLAPTASLIATGTTGALATVGDPSGLAQFTLTASATFNQGLFTILDVLQAVIALEPSQRQPDLRIWGPFPDHDHPGWEVQLVMTRSGDRFDYRIDARRDARSPWSQIILGDFEASGGLRQGTGALHYLAAQARALGYDLNPGEAASVDVTYQTRVEPITVDLVVPSVNSPVPLLAFSYAGQPDGGGQMRFEVTGQVAGGATSSLDTLELLSRWKADGSGRSDAQIIAGDFVGATYVECWSTSATLLYSAPSWTNAVGSEASCPTF